MNAHPTWGDVRGVGDVPGYRRARWKPADSGTRPGSVMGAHGAALWKCAGENARASGGPHGLRPCSDGNVSLEVSGHIWPGLWRLSL